MTRPDDLVNLALRFLVAEIMHFFAAGVVVAEVPVVDRTRSRWSCHWVPFVSVPDGLELLLLP